jgi:hypothetical protein
MKQEIINNNYIRIPEFISRQQAFALAVEFKQYALVNCGGDSQAPNSHAEYDFMPFVKLLVAKTSEVSTLFGDDILPTYTYARVYKTGSVLERHRDRPACEVSLTLNLSKSHNWPIYFQRTDGSETSVELEPGDAVLYMGCISDHWRKKFVGEEYTQVFMHYVRSHGENAWAYFDKKKEGPTQQAQSLQTQIIKPVDVKNKEWKASVI